MCSSIPTFASPGFTQFNALVLELQRLAQEQPLSRFHDQILQRVRALIPFDQAWWGRAALIDGLPDEHSSHVFGLPPEYLQDWQSIRDQDPTVGLVHACPGRAVIVDSQARKRLAACAGWASSTGSASSCASSISTRRPSSACT